MGDDTETLDCSITQETDIGWLRDVLHTVSALPRAARGEWIRTHIDDDDERETILMLVDYG